MGANSIPCSGIPGTPSTPPNGSTPPEGSTPNGGIQAAPDTQNSLDTPGTSTVAHSEAVRDFLKAVRTELTAHPIDLRGFHDRVLDMIYAFYSEYVPLETFKSREKHLVVAEAVLKILMERDAALGVETELVHQPDGEPYNKELEDIITLFMQEESEIEKIAFESGFAAGVRLVFELLGEEPVGVVNS